MTPPPITDAAGRQFRTLRVSLTGTCNLACRYCTSGEPGAAAPPTDYHRLAGHILRLHRRLGLRTLRFTGGEPLLYRDLLPLLRQLRPQMPGVLFKLSTNGFLLARQAAALAEAGLSSVNVSLDAVDEEVFFRMTRRRVLPQVLEGLEAARAAGLAVKINSVIMRGLNEGQVVPLLRYGLSSALPLRFLELMQMGHLHGNFRDHFFSMREILALLRGSGLPFSAAGRERHGTACYWRTPGGYLFGIIANETAPFCHDCDRLRLDSRGQLYGCLCSRRPLPLPEGDGSLDAVLRAALDQKQSAFTGSPLSMMAIGG